MKLESETYKAQRKFQAETMTGHTCSRCGDAPTFSDSRWRWGGKFWEHKCGDAQAGHFRAVKNEEKGAEGR